MNKQDQIPILENLVQCSNYDGLQFYFPGHKQGRFFSDKLKQILGQHTLAIDLPSIDGETDNTFHSEGCIKLAQELTAELYGATHTRFLVHGATSGVITAIMTAVSPNQAILLPRNIHRSVVSGLVLSGSRPVYLMPQSHPMSMYSALSVSVDQVRQAFEQHSDLGAMLLTRPTYYGIANNNIKEIAQICHDHNCPLIVDESHGSHLQFLPEGYPTSALKLLADIVIQSPHKTLGSLSGTAQLHIGHNALIDIDRLQLMLNTLQSTSPNYILLASLDATRHMMWQQGRHLFAKTVKQVEALRDQIEAIHGMTCALLDPRLAEQGYQADPLRLVVNFSEMNLSGFTAAEILEKEYGIRWEMRDHHNIILVLSPQDGVAMYQQLVAALQALANKYSSTVETSAPKYDLIETIPLPILELLPREAVFSHKAVVPFNQAHAKICGEIVTTYPPGIPILCPGEVISKEIIEFCLFLKAQQADIYATDSSLESFVVVDQ